MSCNTCSTSGPSCPPSVGGNYKGMKQQLALQQQQLDELTKLLKQYMPQTANLPTSMAQQRPPTSTPPPPSTTPQPNGGNGMKNGPYTNGGNGNGDPGLCGPNTPVESLCAKCRPGLSPCRLDTHRRWLDKKPFISLSGVVDTGPAGYWALVADADGNQILGRYLLSPVAGKPCFTRVTITIDGSPYTGEAAIELQTPVTVVTPTGEWGTFLDARSGGESVDWTQVKDGRCECSIECGDCVSPVMGDDFNGETNGGFLVLVHFPSTLVFVPGTTIVGLRAQLLWCWDECLEVCPQLRDQCDLVQLSECIPVDDLLNFSRPGPALDWCGTGGGPQPIAPPPVEEAPDAPAPAPQPEGG